MDKNGAKIVLSCIICTLIISILFLIAMSFTRPSCELIVVNDINEFKTNLKPLNLTETKKTRSMLMRMSAYLEYVVVSNSGHLTTTGGSKQAGDIGPVMAPLLNQQQILAQALPVMSINQSTPQTFFQPNHNQQQQFQINRTNLQIGPQPSQVNSSNSLIINTLATTTATHENSGARIMPLDSNGDLDQHRITDNEYQYKLHFNCTTMTMILVLSQNRVLFKRIKLDLKTASQRKMDCEIDLKDNDIAANVNLNGTALYNCDRLDSMNPLKCYHKRTGEPDLPIVELHIQALQFETFGSNPIHNKSLKNKEFSSSLSTCNGF